MAGLPAADQLGAAVTVSELEVLAARFGRLEMFGQSWVQFLTARRPGDEVRRFTGDGGEEGFAVVRQGRPLAQFLAPTPEFEQALLEHAVKQT